MSERSKLNRKVRAQKQEKQGKRIIFWIGAVLILLAIAYVIVATANI